MRLYTESTLSDSFIYSMFNNDMNMTKKVADALKSGIVLDSTYIQEQILQMRRTHLSPLMEDVLDAYDKGIITLVSSPSVRITSGIPFFIVKNGNSNKAFIFTDAFGTVTTNSTVNGGNALNIPMKDLYVLMEAAYLGWSYYEYPMKFKRSIGLMRICNQVYTNMVMRILNREFSLSMDQDLWNQVAFVISRFFLERVWEIENKDIMFNYAIQVCSTTAVRTSLVVTNDLYTQKGIQDVSGLIAFLKELSPRLEKLNTRYFTECYINTYKAPAILSMDTLPYFIFVMCAAFCGSFIIKQEVVSDIIKNTKGANIYYNELSKLI